jgi:hypothetical protein
VRCYYPLTAYQCVSGAVVFAERGDIVRTLQLPCGQCRGCRLERSRQWAIRCMHEAQMHTFNCFITLTYSDEYLSGLSSLVYRDFQLFMKRLRKRFSSTIIRFYMCGEYGEAFGRPHFHACLFGLDFPDKVYLSKSGAGSKIYRSKILEELWPFGFSSVGAVTFESAAYVARYVMKKVTGAQAEAHYYVTDKNTGECFNRVAEFCHMSLRPGIGATWLAKYGSDVYPEGRVVVNGHNSFSPRYYDKLFAKLDPDAAELLAFGRELEGRARYADNTHERLVVKDQVAAARIALLKRSL